MVCISRHPFRHAANDELPKMAHIKAALFTILSNRFDWQLFLEVTVGVILLVKGTSRASWINSAPPQTGHFLIKAP
ncbi:TPA: hypothetical protein U5E33_001442 [Yersinia enterocolitica]|nr:hypothetical protein [Yersinia enterocolitica]